MQKSESEASVRSFEEVYKTSYSHGLESIYRLENIDIKSVRKLGGDPPLSIPIAKSEPSHPAASPSLTEEEPLFELDFGPVWGEYVSPFVVKEPLQILRLSRHIEKCLLGEGLKTLGDLRAIGRPEDLSRLAFVKGLGQGHVEEVKERLALHLAGKPLERAYEIDFASWIRQIVGTLDARVAALLLEPHALSDLITLTPLESMEIKRMTLERREDLREEGRRHLEHPETVKEVRLRFEEIEQIFLIPWMEERGGVISQEELLERLERVSADPKLAAPALQFIHKYFASHPFPLTLKKEGSLYFSSNSRWKEFYDLETLLLSYFWSGGAKVPLEDLFRWVSRDLAAEWRTLELDRIGRMVALSSKFKRQKESSGRLLIMRANRYVQS